MDAKLFGSRVSPFVEKVARALQLKRIGFTVVAPKSPGDFKRWNPQTQKMPVVEIDGRRVFDSTVILRRLDQLVPEPPFFDRDAGVAARQRFLEDWSDESLYWYAMALRWSDANAEATTTQVVGSIPAPAALRPVLRVLLRRQIRNQVSSRRRTATTPVGRANAEYASNSGTTAAPHGRGGGMLAPLPVMV